MNAMASPGQRKSPSQADPQALLTPELLTKLERLELVSRKVFRGRMKGERRSRRKGQSVEFADFRSYVPGDDLRFIDWNLYARLERLFLKLFLEEEDLHVYLLIDNSRSMDFGEPSKFVFARQLAAAVAFVGLCRADRVRIESFTTSARTPGPIWRGRRNLLRMLSYLESIQIDPAASLEEGIKNFCLRNPSRGIVILVSDLLERTGFEAPLRYFLARQFDTLVVQPLSPQEVQPDLSGDLRLIDCEDLSETEISISRPLLDRYEQNLQAFLLRVRSFCTRRGMTVIQPTTNVSLDVLVTQWLRQRGFVR